LSYSYQHTCLNKYIVNIVLSAMMDFQCFYTSIFFLLVLQWSNALPISQTVTDSNELSSCELCNLLLTIAKDFIAVNESSLIEKLGIILC